MKNSNIKSKLQSFCPAEGLSSGQVVGIVIGALLAVVIVIAVVIAAVRRMGKYS